MKKLTTKFKSKAMALIVTGFALATAVYYSTAATIIGALPIASVPVINSVNGNSNNITWGAVQPTGLFATNGLYPCYIPGQTTVSNYVLINGGAISGNNLAVTITTQTGGTGSLTNGQAMLYTALAPVVLWTNSVGDLYPSTNTPLTYLTTITFPVTNGIAMSTNLILSPATTPVWNGALRLYVGSLAFNGATTASLTNFSIYTTQN